MKKGGSLFQRALLYSALLVTLALLVGSLAFRLAYRPYLKRAASSRGFSQMEALSEMVVNGQGEELAGAVKTLVSGGGAVWYEENDEMTLIGGSVTPCPDIVEQMIRDARAGTNSSRLIDFDGELCLFCAGSVVSENTITGVIVTGLPAGDVGDRALMWLWVIVGGITAAAFAWPLLRSMGKPIYEIRDVAVRMAGGDLGARCDDYEGDTGVLAAALNEIAHKQDESTRELIQERNRLEQLINGLSEGVIAISGKSGNSITHMNPAVEKMFPASGVPEPFKDSRLSVIPNEEVWKAFDTVVRTKSPLQLPIVHGNMSITLSVSPLMDAKNECTGAVGLFTDVTAAQKREMARREFIANISHEYRTPLTVIQGLIEPLRDGLIKTESERVRSYRIIIDEIQRLSKMISDQRRLEELENGEAKIAKEMFDIGETLYDVASELTTIAADKDLTVDITTDFAALTNPLMVWSDEDLVRQLLIILGENAVKYTEAGGITLSADWTQDQVILHVEDTGIGISAEDLEHVFERYFKVDKSHSGRRGSGLGLSIANKLIGYLDEKIWVDSTLGKGTRFSFTLARKEKQETLPDPSEDANAEQENESAGEAE